MRLLWVVNTVMPPMAKAIGSRNVVFGGWVYEMIKRLSIDNDFSIGVVTVQSKQLDTLHKNIDGVDYFVLPAKKWNRHDVYQKYVDSVLEQFRPDHIHSEGTENRFSYRFIKSFNGS